MWLNAKFKLHNSQLLIVATILVIDSFWLQILCEEITTQHSIGCTLFVNNSTYDLSPLQRTGSEVGFEAYIATYSKPNSKGRIGIKDAVYLNICGALSEKIGDGCAINHTNSAVCVRYGDTNETRSIGEHNNNKTSLTWNHVTNSIQLVYYGDNSIVNMTLFCREGVFDSRPILMEQKFSKKSNITVYLFEWGISYACPLAIKKGSDCIIRDENDVVVYNLTQLRKPHYYQLNTSKNIYYINVCGSVTGLNLCNTYGSCQVKDKSSVNLGFPNSDLIYEGGTLKLVYENGTDYNANSGLKRKTEISFVCKEESEKKPNVEEKPAFVNEIKETGTYVFKFETSAACRKKVPTVHCSYSNGTHVWDLSRLSYNKQSSFYASKGKLYLLNICRPVNNFQMVGGNRKCKTPAGVCVVDILTESDAVNCGVPKDPPIKLDDGNLAIRYVDGDICPYDKEKRLSSLIKFICGDELGEPMLITGRDSCELVFEWKTVVACNAVELLSDDDCTYKDSRTGLSVDMSVLTHSKKFLHIIFDNQDYSVNICGNQKYFDGPQCKGSAVCLRNRAFDDTITYISLGNISSRTTKYDGSKLV
ncbi:cation-independent mannose-6-phosphate receptor precursor-like protein, partial [Leptotrombidium deliense]